ncbi:branched-chain amino acid ABC transporter permease [Ramlibacter tataouinensis]|uniref:branched-chain amino acid ABC transporter permease n=1 Tax=Ramlibacter tataouinensis TaxID=94132 RepID=UPI0022F3850B|nr:branched-chain amino acid ABC transporter permease [Ramlibacter tataouinensis]WBY03083.1 branched-chain amino acid ABC transporter permease [Ramlibacter tataouinensis]
MSMTPTNPALAATDVGFAPRRGWRRGVFPAIVLLVLVLPPLLLSDFRLTQFTTVAVYGLALLGLILLTGFGGQVSLGHGAIFAVGAYTTAIVMNSFGVSYWMAPLLGAASCFVLGYLFGLPALKLPGHHLALATFGLAVAVPQLLRFKGFDPWTGGFQGLTLVRPDPPFGLSLSGDQWMYLLAVLTLAAVYWIASNLLDSRMGRAIVAVRDHPIAATAMGIDTGSVKTMTFAISSLFTGLAGGLSAVSVLYVSADSFGAMLSITFLVGAVIGGLNSLPGAVFGALIVQFLPLLTERASQSASTAIYGVCVILAMYLMPTGIAGSLRSWVRRTERRARGQAR